MARTPPPNPDAWRESAACHPDRCGLPVDLWVPADRHECGPDCDPASCERTDYPPPDRRALAVCRRCPVAVECAAYAALDGDRTKGLWGGLTHRRRRPLMAARKRAAAVAFSPLCTCGFCRAVRTLVTEGRDGEPRRPLNTAGGRCGHISKYGGGCRCSACTFASSLRSRLANIATASPGPIRTDPYVDSCVHGSPACVACVVIRQVRDAAA